MNASRLIRTFGLLLFSVTIGLVALWVLPPRSAGLHPHIVIDKSRNRLYLFSGGKIVKTYPVATGRDITLTPEGRFRIANKISEPQSGLLTESRLGSRWMGLSTPLNPDGLKHGIHGTDEPESVGLHASAGCIRMNQADIEDLFNRVEVGTPVEIIRGVPELWRIHKWLDRARTP